MVANTVSEDLSSDYDLRKGLSLYMRILHNSCGPFDIYPPIMNNIEFKNMGDHVSSVIFLTCITISQLLGSVIFYNTHIKFSEQYNRGVTQQVFF